MSNLRELRLVQTESDDIVSKIHQLHLEIMTHLRISLELAIEIGELLTQQKARLKHGEWLPWIKENLSFSQPTVFNYMNLYKNRSKLLNVNNLTEAYSLLKGSKSNQIEYKKSLRDACNNLKNAFSHFKHNGFIEELYHFYFTGESLIAREQHFVSYPYQTSFKVAVNGYNLHKVVSEIKEEPVLEIENDQLKITSKSFRASLNIKSGKRFSSYLSKSIESMPYQKINDENWKILPEDFIEGVRRCYLSIGGDSFNIVNYFSVDGNIIESSDEGYRVSRYKMKGEMDRCFIERIVIENLLKFESVFKFYKIVDDWIFFKDEFELVFGGEKIKLNLQFPTISKYFDFEPVAEFDLPRIPVREIFMMKFFADGQFDIDRTVEIIFHDNKLIIQAKDDQKGWIEREYPIKYDGKKIDFLINPVFFSEVMPYSLHCRVGEDQVLLSSESYEHLISLHKK